MSSLLKLIPFINSCLHRSFTYHQSRLIANSTIHQQTQKNIPLSSTRIPISQSRQFTCSWDGARTNINILYFISIDVNTCCNSLECIGNLYNLHHFLTALSVTPKYVPTLTKLLYSLKAFNKEIISGRLSFLLW